MRLTHLAWIALGALALVLGATFALTQDPVRTALGLSSDPCAQGAVGGAIGGPFTLVNGAGETVTEAEVIDQPALVYFGYTFCPDVCPFDMSRNAEAVDLLDGMGLEVTPVFISVDPARDTPEIAGEFAQAHHERAVGLSGTPEQVKAAADAYRVFYRAQGPEEEGDDLYLVDHTVFTYLMHPERGFLDFFGRDVTPEQMAERTACFLRG